MKRLALGKDDIIALLAGALLAVLGFSTGCWGQLFFLWLSFGVAFYGGFWKDQWQRIALVALGVAGFIAAIAFTNPCEGQAVSPPEADALEGSCSFMAPFSCVEADVRSGGSIVYSLRHDGDASFVLQELSWRLAGSDQWLSCGTTPNDFEPFLPGETQKFVCYGELLQDALEGLEAVGVELEMAGTKGEVVSGELFADVS